MAGAGVRIDLEWDDAEVRGALTRMERVAEDPRAVFDEIGAMLVATVARRFETGTGPDGKKWPPSKRAGRDGGQTLVKSGRLGSSVTHRVDATGVDVGTNVIYAAIHQFGGTIKQKARRQTLAFRRVKTASGAYVMRFASRKSTRARKAGTVRVAFAEIGAREIAMPARPFLGLDASDRDAVLEIAARAISRAAGATS